MKDNKPTIKSTKDRMKKAANFEPPFPESEFERDVAQRVYTTFTNWRDERDRSYAFFDNRTLIDFIEDSVYRYVTAVYERDNIEDWQSRVHIPITRNKINNISGRAIQSLPIGQVVGTGLGKAMRVTILNNLYEHSEETNQYALIMSDVITEALVKGTAVIYEGHRKETNLEREILTDGTVKEKTIVKNSLITEIVPLEDFYPSTVFARTVDDLVGAAWREVLDHSKFLNKYGSFELAQYVPVRNNAATTDIPDFRDDIFKIVGEGLVEVLHVYNKFLDEYVLLANGYWINPVKLTLDTEDEAKIFISPIPFKHKKLPFAILKFESLGVNFLYGNSMPNKLRESQDQLNVMSNMAFDQSMIGLFTPIITSAGDMIEDDFLRPGRRIDIDIGDRSIRESVMPLQMNPPSGWYQFILNYTKSILEEASVDALSQGSVADLADRTTAKAVELAAAGVASSLSYFGLQIQEFVKTKTKLRIPNIIQIYFDKKNPLAHRVVGESIEYINQAFNKNLLAEISLDSAELSPSQDGKVQRGRKIIQIYQSKDDRPTVEELRMASAIEKATSGKDVEIVAIPADYFRDMFEFDVRVVADKRVESTQATEQALSMYKAQTYMQLGQGLVDRTEILADLMQKNGDDPSRFILSLDQQEEQAQQGQQQQQPGMPGGGANTNNLGNNITQQVAGAAQRLGQ